MKITETVTMTIELDAEDLDKLRGEFERMVEEWDVDWEDIPTLSAIDDKVR